MERDHVIAIDVGGRVFKVLRPTVMKYPDSTLALVLAGKDLQNLVIVDKTYFFDRNPDYFAVILDYMRNGQLFLPPNLSKEQMVAEAEFWKMNGMLKELTKSAPKAAPVAATPPLEPDSPATPPLGRSMMASPPLEPAAAPAQFAPTLLLDDPRPAPTLLLNPPPAVPNYQPTLLLDPAPAYQPTLPLTTTSPAPNIAATLLLDEGNKPNFAPTLLMDAGPGFAPTLLLDEYAKTPAPPSPSMFDDAKPAAYAPTLLFEEPPKAAPRHPLKAKPPPAIQPTLLLPDLAPAPGTPELPSTPKLTDDEDKPQQPANHPPKREEVKQPPKKEEAKQPAKPQKDDDLLGSLVKTQDQGPARALPFGGGVGKPAAKKGKPVPNLKRQRESSSEGSNKLEESFESSFIDDDSESEPEEYKPKKKTKKEPKKKPVKGPKKRRGSEEIPAKQPAIVILLSGFPDKDRKATEAIVGRLGGVVAESFEQEPSHLVMPEFKRNIKLLVAICKGVALVKNTWIQESQRQGKWLDIANFPLCTPAAEATYRFSYANAMQRAKQQRTF